MNNVKKYFLRRRPVPRQFIAILIIFCFPTTLIYGHAKVIIHQNDDLTKILAEAKKDFVIEEDIDLMGKKVNIGEDCILTFQGGSFSNGTIVGNNTSILAENYEIFKRGYVRYRSYIPDEAKRDSHPSVIKEFHNCLFIKGTWNNTKCGTNWTGLLTDTHEDAMLAIQNYVTLHQSGSMVIFPKIDVLGYDRAILPGSHIVDFNNSTISYPDNLSEWEDQSINIPAKANPCPMESGYGLISLKSNTTIKNLTIDGKSTFRQKEPVRLGVSCVVAIGGAQDVTLENINIVNVLGPAVTTQAGAKDVLYRKCRFFNIGEHVIYSHQYQGFCRFENCTFDTWDSNRVSEYRNGLDYLYKHTPSYEEGKISYDELYRFDLSFNKCTFNNPTRVTSQGRTLGAFFTGTFPVIIKVNDCKFIGSYPAVNPGRGCAMSETSKKPFRLVMRGCDGAPYVYSAKLNCNFITEFYDCVNIPFRTVYAKRYERCKLYLDAYESNTEVVTPAFEKEFCEPLLIRDCVFFDRGEKVNINHPLINRPVIFEHCNFSSVAKRPAVSNVITAKTKKEAKVIFRNCVIDIPDYRLIGGKKTKKYLSVENCDIKAVRNDN